MPYQSKPAIALALSFAFTAQLWGQGAVTQPQREERDKARQHAEKQQQKAALKSANIDFRGEKSFGDEDLRRALKEQIPTVDQYGLSPARADDVAFFLELFY